MLVNKALNPLDLPPKTSPDVEVYSELKMTGRQDIKKKEFTPEQIITMLTEAVVLVTQGGKAVKETRKLGITEQTYYRWRREYGGCVLNRRRD